MNVKNRVYENGPLFEYIYNIIVTIFVIRTKPTGIYYYFFDFEDHEFFEKHKDSCASLNKIVSEIPGVKVLKFLRSNGELWRDYKLAGQYMNMDEYNAHYPIYVSNLGTNCLDTIDGLIVKWSDNLIFD